MLIGATTADQDIMARTICGEARGEGDIGMQAVAHVILNRFEAQQPHWGLTITEVCRKPYQFSCWNRGDPNLAIILNLDSNYTIFVDALTIAGKVMSGELPDITGGATFYFVKNLPFPTWAEGHTPCATIGHHIFFNDIT